VLSGPARKLSPHYHWNVNAEHTNAAPAIKIFPDSFRPVGHGIEVPSMSLVPQIAAKFLRCRNLLPGATNGPEVAQEDLL
jgi:hypothetical protein